MGRAHNAAILIMSTVVRHMVVATAGHIDHGKTALVRALTGMETDQLAEEKRRGITIELGFAFLGDHITIIDVPGHERFIKTMVAGVATVDLALLVVAADDGIMPQTREHLAILNLLGVPNLFVVLTKIADLNDDWLKLVEEDVKKILPNAYQSNYRLFLCDSLSGQGIKELKEAILDFPEKLPPRPEGGVFRLPVDRAFTLKGFGTIVTGTILGGEVKAGDRLQVMPLEAEVRVRGIQSHGRDESGLGVGQRAALNLIGQNLNLIRRGHWICARDFFQATDILDVRLETLTDAPTLKNRDRIRLHIGTEEAIGRLVLFGKDVIPPGGKAFAQILLEAKIMATRGDRFVFRRYSPLQTLGGGRVLDPVPERRRRTDSAALESFEILDKTRGQEALVHKIRESGRAGLTMKAARTFTNAPQVELDDWIHQLVIEGLILKIGIREGARLVSTDIVKEAMLAALQKVDDYHRRQPQILGIKQASLISELSADFPVPVIEHAIGELLKGEVILDKGCIRRFGHVMKLDSSTEALIEQIEDMLEGAAFTPPSFDEIRKRVGLSEAELNRILDVMNQQGRIIRMADGSPWSRNRVREAWEILKPVIGEGQGKSMSELREVLGCPRRFTITLIGYFDSVGLTERREDLRLPGPKFDEKF